MKRFLIVFILLMGLVYLTAQTTAFQPSNPFGSSSWQGSLLNPNKLHMSNSASFSTMMSNNQGYYQSVYTNHLQYQFNPKLSMNVNLNFVNYGSTSRKNLRFQGNGDNQNRIIPEFSMTYKPTENFIIRIETGRGTWDQNVNSEAYFWRPNDEFWWRP